MSNYQGSRLLIWSLDVILLLELYLLIVQRPNIALNTIHYGENIHHFFYIFGYLLVFTNI